MLINRENLEAAYIGFNTTFQDALGLYPSLYSQLVTEVRAIGQETVQYKWLGSHPLMKEWLGEREIERLRAHSYAITKRKWANGIEVDADDIKFDRLGLVTPRIQGLADSAMSHLDEIVNELICGGFSDGYGLAYDGQYFFDTDHTSEGEASQSNHTQDLLDKDSFVAGYDAMSLFVDPRGRPLNTRPTHLMVGPANRATAEGILKQQRLANGEDNINYQRVELIVNPWLRATTADANRGKKWFLFDLSKRIKPFILQIYEDLAFDALDDYSTETSFLRDVFLYGARAQHNAGYSLPLLAYGSDGAGS